MGARGFGGFSQRASAAPQARRQLFGGDPRPSLTFQGQSQPTAHFPSAACALRLNATPPTTRRCRLCCRCRGVPVHRTRPPATPQNWSTAMRGSGGDYAAVLAVGLPQGGAFSKLLFTGKPLVMVATSIQRSPCHSACVRNDAAVAMRYSQSLVGVNPVSAARALRTGRLRTDQEAAADVSGWVGRGGAAITFFGRWTTLSIALAPLNGVTSGCRPSRPRDVLGRKPRHGTPLCARRQHGARVARPRACIGHARTLPRRRPRAVSLATYREQVPKFTLPETFWGRRG